MKSDNDHLSHFVREIVDHLAVEEPERIDPEDLKRLSVIQTAIEDLHDRVVF